VMSAEANGAYSRRPEIGLDRPDWMASLPDHLLLSELSLPGTHDTMAHLGGDDASQSADLFTQLHSGIRALDIRCRNEPHEGLDQLGIWRRLTFQGTWFLRDVAAVCREFLTSHPRETLTMRIKKEREDHEDSRRSFGEVFLSYREAFPGLFWDGPSRIPTLGETRGRIVVWQDLDSCAETPRFGLGYSNRTPRLPPFAIQDEFWVPTPAAIGDKWKAVQRHLLATNRGNRRAWWFVNYLSGASDGCAPHICAGGSSGGEAGDERTANPEGITRRMLALLRSGRLGELTDPAAERGYHVPLVCAGTCMMDFPGPALLDTIIDLNQR